ncbi:endonuclease domain-containing protein [Streptomyces zhihengii]|uniref:endonuclease domain-containing protein n=1 Tax=Streptomyces zhihengii TaxID=1818004 RepID=UPI0036329518
MDVTLSEVVAVIGQWVRATNPETGASVEGQLVSYTTRPSVLLRTGPCWTQSAPMDWDLVYRPLPDEDHAEGEHGDHLHCRMCMLAWVSSGMLPAPPSVKRRSAEEITDEELSVLYDRLDLLVARHQPLSDRAHLEALLEGDPDERLRLVSQSMWKERDRAVAAERALAAASPALGSAIERAFWQAYQEAAPPELSGLKTQHPVFDGRYRLDFALPGRKVGIELDGYAWHSSPEAFTRDRARQRELELAGWRIIRFSGSEVTTDAAGCVRQAAELAARVSPIEVPIGSKGDPA